MLHIDFEIYEIISREKLYPLFLIIINNIQTTKYLIINDKI